MPRKKTEPGSQISKLYNISEAPRNAKEITLVTTEGAFTAHYACDHSGEDQPAFGPAWFYMPRSGDTYANYYREVPGKILGWKPLDQYAREPETTA